MCEPIAITITAHRDLYRYSGVSIRRCLYACAGAHMYVYMYASVYILCKQLLECGGIGKWAIDLFRYNFLISLSLRTQIIRLAHLQKVIEYLQNCKSGKYCISNFKECFLSLGIYSLIKYFEIIQYNIWNVWFYHEIFVLFNIYC